MKRRLLHALAAVVALLALIVPALANATEPEAAAKTLVATPSEDLLPGVDLAQGITQLTGVAISPLLGVSAVGAWQYFRTPAPQRARLPWYCHPLAWGAGLCLLSLCLLKDVVGTASPPLLKKPLDVAELFENKASALVACSAFVPFVASQMAQHSSLQASSLSGDLHFASALSLGGFDLRILFIPLAILGFATVWLASHAINVLIALCPFGFVDGILKLFKACLLGVVGLAAVISPYSGVAISLLIVFGAAMLAPWAFRLAVFGTLFGLDVLLPWRGRRSLRPSAPHGFLARKIAGTPIRTYGRLTRSHDGTVTFSYRPWLIFPERILSLPAGKVRIAKGILFPSLLHSSDEQQRHRIVVMFLPRYRSHEQSIAKYFEIVDIHDSPLIKGFKAVRSWFAEMLDSGKSKYAPVSARMAS